MVLWAQIGFFSWRWKQCVTPKYLYFSPSLQGDWI